MENGIEAKPEVVAEEKPVVPGPFLGGEVHIIADAQTGGIQVNAPQNLIIAFGLLEAAKMILVERQQQMMRKRTPEIVRPGADALSKLSRPS